jgi:hypothetical protein
VLSATWIFMERTYTPPSIDEYLQKRLMVEGAIPHVQGIEMCGNSIPAETVGGDLFEYINFQQRYDIDARIQRAQKRSKEYLQPLPADGMPRNSVDDHVKWLKSGPSYKQEMESAYREHEAQNRHGSPKTCATCIRRPESCWWTLRGTELLRQKSRQRSMTRFMPSCSPNSIIAEKRLANYSRGST